MPHDDVRLQVHMHKQVQKSIKQKITLLETTTMKTDLYKLKQDQKYQ